MYLNVLTLVSLVRSDHHFYFDRAKEEREVKEKIFTFLFSSSTTSLIKNLTSAFREGLNGRGGGGSL